MRRLLLVPAFVAACGVSAALGDDGLRAVALTFARVTAALGYTPLNPANNLSDLSVAGTARTNLGLGTAATQNTGTSGASIPLLSGSNNWAGANVFMAGTLWQDSGTQTLNNGILTEASSQLIDFGINDSRFPGTAVAANPGGYARLDGRSGAPFFAIYQKAAGVAVGLSAAVKVFSVDGGLLVIPKLSAPPTTAVGTGFVGLFAVSGTNSGTCKVQFIAGTSTTPVTIVDNGGVSC